MKVVFRQPFIEEYVTGKVVLDLGSIEHDLYRENIERGKWLFDKIHRRAKKAIGIDILPEAIEELKKAGYDLRYGDVEHLDQLKFEEKFDLIIAGELIEHLSNPGLFLNGIARHMGENTELLISTPNAFGFIRFIDAAIRRERTRPDHVAWHSARTLSQLIEANGLKVKEIIFYSFLSGKKRSVFLTKIRKFIFKFFPYFSDGLIAIAVKPVQQV
ncbi:MAG: class I SAM-dependent methyltransferase [candidate division KSB1 bacterium]|nr:class I SAM-dependent methyltransferase [candidate division KSB1 bacterium]